jgi:hypothetical protein
MPSSLLPNKQTKPITKRIRERRRRGRRRSSRNRNRECFFRRELP